MWMNRSATSKEEVEGRADEIEKLRARVAELETRLSSEGVKV